MLSPNFVDWWFSPWEYAAGPSALPPTDQLGLRDGYRMWCKHAGVPPDLPDAFDPGWESAACIDEIQLIATARLFGGLFAAREHDDAALSALPFVDRKWCLSVAATQPLKRNLDAVKLQKHAVEMQGLAELALHLNHGFSGIWPRLRTTLRVEDVALLDAVIDLVDVDLTRMEATAPRAQRCWRMCRNRINAGLATSLSETMARAA